MNQPWLRSVLRRTGYRIGKRLLPFVNRRSAAICLHDLGNPDPRHYTSERFRELVEWISPRFETKTASRLLDASTGPETPTLYLTFDDGYRNQFEIGAPILEEADVKGTFFVPVDLIGQSFPADGEDSSAVMTWSHLQGLRENGHEIGSHALTNQALPSLPVQEQRRQIEDSKRILEDKLGTHVDCFAYPMSRWDDATIRLVRETGYALGFTTDERLLDPETDPFRLPRLKVSNQLSLDELKVKLSSLHPLITTLGSYV